MPKTGLVTEFTGALWLADLGIPAEAYRRAGVVVPPRIFGTEIRVRLS